MEPRPHILITGGSRGIGAATVRAAVARGWAVTFSYAAAGDTADALVAELAGTGGDVQAVRSDAADGAAVENLLDRATGRFGLPTGVVANAGITVPITPFVDADLDRSRDMFALNVFGVMELCQRVLRRWLAEPAPDRTIVTISSGAARSGSPGEYIPYAAAKAAVETFTIGLAREFGPAGIRAVAVAPGFVRTEIHASSGDPGRLDRLAERVALRRPGEPAEIADGIVWCLSDAARYLTGVVVPVNGGL